MKRRYSSILSLLLCTIVLFAQPCAWCSEEDADAANNHAASLIQDGEYEEAVVYAKQAITTYPNKGIYYSTLGLAYYKMNELDEVISSLTNAIELDYKEAEVYSVLGNAYFKKDMLEEARAAYQQALEIDPSLPGARNNLETVESILEEQEK